MERDGEGWRGVKRGGRVERGEEGWKGGEGGRGMERDGIDGKVLTIGEVHTASSSSEYCVLWDDEESG